MFLLFMAVYVIMRNILMRYSDILYGDILAWPSTTAFLNISKSKYMRYKFVITKINYS